MDDDRYVPGTVYLVDLKGVLDAKHASGSQMDIVLVPSPSADPDDPLNWSARRKLLSTTCVCVRRHLLTFKYNIQALMI